MSLPSTIRVKISSEAADLITISPVVVQEMRTEELVRLMLGITRKDASRVGDILRRGSFVSGASRFRWEPSMFELEKIREYLTRYPDPDPSRVFQWAHVTAIHFRSLAIEREVASKRRFLRRSSFWDVLTQCITAPGYIDYSYKDSADVYRAELAEDQQMRLRQAADLLTYPTLAGQVRASTLSQVDLLTRRS